MPEMPGHAARKKMPIVFCRTPWGKAFFSAKTSKHQKANTQGAG